MPDHESNSPLPDNQGACQPAGRGLHRCGRNPPDHTGAIVQTENVSSLGDEGHHWSDDQTLAASIADHGTSLAALDTGPKAFQHLRKGYLT
jgi:hypothetical protein